MKNELLGWRGCKRNAAPVECFAALKEKRELRVLGLYVFFML